MVCFAASGRTFTVSDTARGQWALARKLADPAGTGAGIEFWVYPNHPGGISSVSVTHGSETGRFAVGAFEIAGLGADATVRIGDTLTDAVATNDHTCSTLGVSFASECLAVCGAANNGNTQITGYTPGTGYVGSGVADSSNGSGFVQAKVFGSGAVNEVGAWTQLGLARIFVNGIILLTPGGGRLGGKRHQLWPDRRSKPRFGAVEVDRSNPMTRGLASLWLLNEGAGNTLVDITGNGFRASGGAGQWAGVPEDGIALDIQDGTTTYTLAKRFTGTEITVLARVRWGVEGAGADQYIFSNDGGFSFAPAVSLFGSRGAGTIRWNLTFSGGNYALSYPSPAVPNYPFVGTWNTIGGTAKSGSTSKLYVDGILRATAPGTATFDLANSDHDYQIGSAVDGSRTANSQILWLAVWQRELTADEIARVTGDFYQLVRPVKRRVLYSVPAAGGGTLDIYSDGAIIFRHE